MWVFDTFVIRQKMRYISIKIKKEKHLDDFIEIMNLFRRTKGIDTKVDTVNELVKFYRENSANARYFMKKKRDDIPKYGIL